MWRDLVLIGLGFLVARALIKPDPEKYSKKEKKFVNKVQNSLHDFLKDQFPDASDSEIGEKVLEMTES